eukprot:1911247-Amphidinium_carterae.1
MRYEVQIKAFCRRFWGDFCSFLFLFRGSLGAVVLVQFLVPMKMSPGEVLTQPKLLGLLPKRCTAVSCLIRQAPPRSTIDTPSRR